MESTTATNNSSSSSNNNNNSTTNLSNSNNSMNNSIMEPNPIDLYEFLVESELQHYYNSIKTELKIIHVTHLKYATDEDFRQIGLSKPEIRRLRKFYDKYYPHGYLSKIRRLLQNPTIKRDDATVNNPTIQSEPIKVVNSPSKMPNNKHIIPADSICVNKQLGIGEFGIVQQGVWTNGTERIQVAIKCLCRDRMQSNPMEFLKEAAIMHSIEHENIVRLYGVVLDTESLMLVTELAHLRSLLECLKDSGLRVNFLTVSTLCEFAMQICNGMMYLENKRLIHRDLAARNILVFSKNKVKISDFGLSRALGVGKDYYQTNFNVNLKLPIAWCAPECINFLRFTNASDVWAYGVCLWEMFSYGFQPWAALTGHQILEAIDEPNYQRLEQPECCPKEYYSALMLKCWQHDPLKRPKFHEIYSMLPDMKPEQLKTISGFSEIKKDHLMYRQNDLITVLDKSSNSPYWKGVLNTGKTGLFNPVNTVTYLGSLPSSTNRDSLYRTTERSSKRKLRTEMISRPQNDFKHTGHVGLDGAYFGDVSFLSNQQNYNHVPRQVVTPYKPSEDIEQTPLLLPPTPTSPDSLQTASGYFAEGNLTASTNHSFINHSNELNHSNVQFNNNNNNLTSAFNFQSGESSTGASPMMGSATTNTNTEFNASNPFAMITTAGQSTENGNGGGGGGILLRQHLSSTSADDASGSFTNTNLEVEGFYKKTINWSDEEQQRLGAGKCTDSNNDNGNHEYHEISDDELPGDKVFDLGPSLLEEISYTLRGMNTNNNVDRMIDQQEPKSPDFDNTNKKNEMTELSAMLSKISIGNGSGSGILSGTLTNSKNKKKPGSVKHISVKDEKILNQAINFANEISAKSMTDLVAETPVAQSPKRKFSFRFPNLTNHGNGNHGGGGGGGGIHGHSANGNDKDHNGMGGMGGNGGNGNCGSAASGNCAGGSSGNNNNGSIQSNNSNTLTYSNNHRTRNFSEEIKNVPDLQNSLTEECREAYNSLVEKPSATMGRYDYEKTKIDHLEQLMEKRLAAAAAAAATAAAASAAVTLPRKSTTLGSTQSTQIIAGAGGGGCSTIHKFKDLSFDRERLTPPPPPPPPQSSVSTKSNLESTVVDSNPLRILRDKNYPIVRPRVKVQSIINGENNENNNNNNNNNNIINGNRNSTGNHQILSDSNGDQQQQQQQQQCESPSYLQNNEYTFNERDVNLYRGGSQKFIGQKEIVVDTLLNTVPLPPRDRNKPVQTNMKRHVRKHPLIMTGTGVQRTLNKVNGNDNEFSTTTTTTTITTVDPSIQVPTGIAPSIPKQTDENNYNTKQLTKPVTQISKLKGLTTDANQNISNYNQNHHSYMNQQDAMNNNNHNISSPKIISNIKNDNTIFNTKTIDINSIYQNVQPTANQQQQQQQQQSINNINNNLTTQITDVDFDDDTASLHFESILEGEKVCEMSSPDVTDGHFMFDIVKEDDYRSHQQQQQQPHQLQPQLQPSSSLEESNNNNNNNNNNNRIVNTQKIPADLIERKKLEFSKKYPKYIQPKNELANNVLFNKIKETVELQQDDTDGGGTVGRTVGINIKTPVTASDDDGIAIIESTLTGTTSSTTQTTTTTTITTKFKPQLTIDITGANASAIRNRHSIKSNLPDSLFIQQQQQQQKQTPEVEQPQIVDNIGNKGKGDGDDGDDKATAVGGGIVGTRPVGSFTIIEQKTNDKSSSSYTAASALLTKDSNSVSCEDLLEFSDKKPKGRERGIESDEVRIMLKVLGKDVAPEKCMFALESIDWDVHKAIKLVKLQNSLSDCNLMYEECIEVLMKYDWDLQTAVQKLRYN